MSQNTKIVPPRRRKDDENAAASTDTPTKFNHTREDRIVRFNKHIKKSTADDYAMLAITTEIKIPKLLEEGLALLEKKYGKV